MNFFLHSSFKNHYLLLFFALLFTSQSAFAWVKVASIFSNGMVLQRNKPIHIWGTASKDEVINVELRGQFGTTRPDASGNWEAVIPALPAGGPYMVSVLGTERVFIFDVLIGDVYLASGQSNMEWSMEACAPLYNDSIATSTDRLLHLIKINQGQAGVAQKDALNTNWIEASPKSVREFSAVAYLLARKLRKQNNVPIGIIQATYSGTSINKWLPYEESFKFPEYSSTVLKMKSQGAGTENFVEIEQFRQNGFFKAFLQSLDKEPNHYSFIRKEWLKSHRSTSNWPTVYEPGKLSDMFPAQSGIYYLTKKVRLLPSMRQGKTYSILLGDSDSEDSVFINGTFVGANVNNTKERKYYFNLPANEDSLSFLIKLTHYKGKVGFYKNSPFQLASSQDTMQLSGAWHVLQGIDFVKEKAPNRAGIPEKPTGIYNAMIAPVIRYTTSGTLWYQGESNTSKSYQYKQELTALVNGWKQASGDEKRPFYLVQLPDYGIPKANPDESSWAEIREVQQQVAQEQPYVALINIIDQNEPTDLHPKAKLLVANRILQMTNAVPNEKGFYPLLGPSLPIVTIGKADITLDFGKTRFSGNPAACFFAIADENGKWKWANAEMKKNKLVLSHPEIISPKYVRYAWADNPKKPLLADENGQPVFPFRTDAFLYSTAPKK